MAASLAQIQEELLKSLKSIAGLSSELGAVNKKVEFLNGDRMQKEGIIEELKSSNRQLVTMMTNFGNAGREGREMRTVDIELIDMKVMNPKSYDGKPASNFKPWAKKVRSYCNASRPGFRRLFVWIEQQVSPITAESLQNFDWK